MTELDQLVQIEDVLEQESKNRRALALLLDKERERQGHLVALACNMGVTRSYLASVSLEWVEQKVKYATELPIFKEYIDPESRQIRLDHETASMIQQRVPDFSRQMELTLYLAARPTHKFPPLLLVVTQSWVDDPNADEWARDGVATRDSVSVRGLDSASAYVDLQIDETRDFLYAIDGQHRLMAFQGLKELLSRGHLYPKNKEGKEKNTGRIDLDFVIEKSNGRLSRGKLQGLVGERVGVEIIPAVLKGETRTEALRRLRSVFVHVNKTARPLTKGELALLDEDDGFAVVSRAVAYSNPLFSQERVELKKGQLAETSSALTTLDTLKTMSKSLLIHDYPGWESDFGQKGLAVRPDEAEIDAAIDTMHSVCSKLGQIPAFAEIIAGESPAKIRNFSDGRGHLLARPLGQLALFEAIGHLRASAQLDMDDVVRKLIEADRSDQLRCNSKTTPWFGVVVDPFKGTMNRSKGAQTLATRLLIHLLAGGTPEKAARDELLSDFREARCVDKEREQGIDLDGRQVPLDKIMLPKPW